MSGILQGGCGNPILSALFFCSFVVIITMILLNLFTAVVLENFQIQEEQAEWTLTPAALEVNPPPTPTPTLPPTGLLCGRIPVYTIGVWRLLHGVIALYFRLRSVIHASYIA